nr:primosomal protein [Klebsiella pneumoniae]
MARIRTIKPEFWTDEDMAEVSEPACLLAIGLLNYADDE